MASREAHGEPLRRIRHALELWKVSGYVVWADKHEIKRFLAKLDRKKYTKLKIQNLMYKHVCCSGGKVKEQDSHEEDHYDADVWYSIVLPIEQREVFIKFEIHPDEEDDPGIRIVSIHPPNK